MKVFSISFITALLLFSSFSCEEICKTCVLCRSYDSSGDVVNEVTQCYVDTAAVSGYKDGFILGAQESGKSALCFDEGVKCKTKRQWAKE